MTKRHGTRLGQVIYAALLGAVVAGGLTAAHGADDGGRGSDEDKVRRGFEIAPVPLNLKGKNRDLVGLGSYLVNAVADCNGCHTANPATEYTAAGNPYFKGNPPQIVNQQTYLGGGRNFGALVTGLTPDIVSRNLTPDKSGRPVGGLTFAEFSYVLRTGADLDHLHPNCSAAATANCFPGFLPFNGDLLQIMPWPVYQNMSVREMRAIYEYLASVPCVSGPDSGVLHNDCY
jgi:hypothetical protein